MAFGFESWQNYDLTKLFQVLMPAVDKNSEYLKILSRINKRIDRNVQLEITWVSFTANNLFKSFKSMSWKRKDSSYLVKFKN